MRKIVKIVLLIMIVVPTSILGYFIYNNNRAVEMPSFEEFSKSFEKGTQWLVDNQDMILEDRDVMLWWMVMRSSELTGDKRLIDLFNKFQRKWIDPNPYNVWNGMFNIDRKANLPPLWELLEQDPYIIYFVYAVTCDKELGEMDIVKSQNEEDWCWKNHPLAPHCLTHHLMGLRLLQRSGCCGSEEVERLIENYQIKIAKQLTFDPRLVDVYVQRVLMLVESGAFDLVKPIWFVNVLNAQLTEGGWNGIHPLVPFGSKKYLAFTGRLIEIRENISCFHTTAQGVFLMSLLIKQLDTASIH